MVLLLAFLAGVIGPSSTVAQSTDPLVTVIVKLDAAPLATYAGQIAELPATSPSATGVRRLPVQSSAVQSYAAFLTQREQAFASALAAVAPGARVVESLRHVIGGVTLVVPQSQVGQLSGLPGVQAVYPSVLRQLQTDRSPTFIRATDLWWLVGGPASAGEGVVVGVIDTGAWPEHPSLADPDAAGKHYEAPPATWTGVGCQFGSAVSGDAPFACNNKLIGARRFMAAYDAAIPLLPKEFPSARDDNGHGTHTSTTAAGNRSVAASIYGLPRWPVSGIAPRAHVAVYKACGDAGCFTADLVAAINQAVADGVDVINYSIGSTVPSDPYTDADSLAFRDAYAAGVFVAVSAGNAGPGANTIGSPANAPWVTSVGASTTNRFFMSRQVRLRSTDGSVLDITGASITRGLASRPVVRAQDFGDTFCDNPFPGGTFQGQIVICQRGGTSARVQKSFNVGAGGAGGMFLYNAIPQDILTDTHFLPSVHFTSTVGASLLAFVAGHPGVAASFPAGTATGTTGDVMAFFSSRGGTSQGLHTIKPDVTAPGVQILAGNTPLPATTESGFPGQLFQAIAGTSMSSPHVAGMGALLTQLHPHWKPGQIKSALMTTAIESVLKETGSPATPFDDGAGRVDGRAWKAVLTLDATAADFVTHRFAPWNINYPSLYHPGLAGSLTVARTVHGDLAISSRWKIEASSAAGLSIAVTPTVLAVPALGNATFQVTVNTGAIPSGLYFGTITLRRMFGPIPLGDVLHLPVAVRKP